MADGGGRGAGLERSGESVGSSLTAEFALDPCKAAMKRQGGGSFTSEAGVSEARACVSASAHDGQRLEWNVWHITRLKVAKFSFTVLTMLLQI